MEEEWYQLPVSWSKRESRMESNGIADGGWKSRVEDGIVDEVQGRKNQEQKKKSSWRVQDP